MRSSSKSIFQLTTSRRGRLLPRQCTPTTHTYFNSRPHEEVDMCKKAQVFHALTFQLTTSRRGRRFVSFFLKQESYFNSRPHEEVDKRSIAGYMLEASISTHDLTKRSTISCTCDYLATYISTHDLTKRSTGKQVWQIFLLMMISTHDLTKRSTVLMLRLSIVALFQLTTSRRGRHHCQCWNR